MTPRQRLYEKAKAFTTKLRTLHTRSMLFYSAKEIESCSFNLRWLYQRSLAAEQLGYEVIMKADDEGLHASYRKKMPEVPMELR